MKPKDSAHTEPKYEPFRLSHKFVSEYAALTENPFGFDGLGEFVYMRTYSRLKPDGTKERWCDTVERVVNGTFNMQKRWITDNCLVWDESRAQRSAKDMFERIYTLKFCPPGRGLWAMGSPITEDKSLFAALNNCAFVSTIDMANNPSKPFVFLMDASMLGIGVGFDTRGKGSITIVNPTEPSGDVYVIPDSREGWVESMRLLLDSYFLPNHSRVEFDYSQIRAKDMPIKTFGGISSGPDCLRKLHVAIRSTLDLEIGKSISITNIVDLMNHIGVCVVSGNVRRTAEIAFGEACDEFLDLKNYDKNPERAAYGWTSNNSVFVKVGDDYHSICERIICNGEPGLAWIDNMRRYGRMCEAPNDLDYRATGGNPCLEQTLESYEMCCLVETFPNRHDSFEDFKKTLESAFLYAKTVTLGHTHWPDTNAVMMRNRRIGCSMSGLAQFIASKGMDELKTWCSEGYKAIKACDRRVSEFFAIRESIKTTSIKPSGTVSLLAGATPGLHYPISRFYIRRVRMSSTSEYIAPLRAAGFNVVPAEHCTSTMIAEFPTDAGAGVSALSEVSMLKQMELAAILQEYWSDNQVSVSITIPRNTTAAELESAIKKHETKIKGMSFIPDDPTVYPQMPYEEITRESYIQLKSTTRSVDYHNHKNVDNRDAVPERYCDGDFCVL